jgi:uncharacterized protein DUF2510
MQEFESISTSSYDPPALAAKITAKAAEGWSVVAIVPTGGDVTAFLSRESGGDTSSTASTEPVESTEWVDSVDSEESAEATAEPETAIIDSDPDPETEPASEPSGWAIAPEPATPTTPEQTDVSPTPTYEPTLGYEPTPTYQPAPAPAPEPPPVPTVPAGWYADPAGRFELRYWDGSTWTEHVSRAGQQFTDPPVA